MPSMIDVASNSERQAILRALLSESSGFTLKSLSDRLQMRLDILQEHLDKLVKSSLVLPPTDERGYYQISSMGRIILEDLKQEKPKRRR
jgi:predicted transcriptional regulator